MLRPAYLALLVTIGLTACQGVGQNPNCTENLFSYTDNENEALLELHSGKYNGALGKFAKAAQSRLACVAGGNDRTQAMNAGYAAFDTAGQAVAAKRLGKDQDARRLMVSAKRMAAQVLNYQAIPPTMRWSMQKLANQ